MQRSKNDVWVGLFVLLGAVAVLFLACLFLAPLAGHDQQANNRPETAMGLVSLLPYASEFGVRQSAVAGLDRGWRLHALHRAAVNVAATDRPSKQTAQDGKHIAPIGDLSVRHPIEH